MILAVDPGGTTGWATWTDEGVTYGQDSPLDFCTRAHFLIAAAVERGEHVEVVSESFVIREDTLKKTRQYDALEQIGTLKYLAHLLYQGEVILQSPADAKRLISNTVLKKLGWYAVGLDHARDATRHLAYRCLKRGLIRMPA